MKSTSHIAISRRAFLAGSLTLAAGVACSGCASAQSSEGATSDGSTAESSGASSQEETSAAQLTLTGAAAHASTNYNPVGLNGGSSLTMSATNHVLEGLYDFNLRTFKPYEALAAEQPQMLSDTQCEITLRDGAAFSDGTPVTADDVANAFAKNMGNPTTGPLLDCIQAVSAKDERTVSITLNYPMGDLLTSRLALVKVFPAAREAELDTLPIGSGPWAYVPGKLDGENSIAFVPNQHYNGPFPAKADSMTWTVALNDGARATALRDNAVQVAESISADNVAQLERADAMVEHIQSFSQAFLMFNTLKEPFSDKRVRKAVFYAIDVEKLVKERMGGYAAPLTGFLPEGHANYHRASTVYEHDPDRARALLKAAGYDKLKIKLSVNDNWVANLASSIADNLRECGIECDVAVHSLRWNEFADTGKVLPYDVVLASGNPSRFGNDPDVLMSWWYGDNVWTRGRSCWARDASGSFAEMQELLMAARMATGDERQSLWNQCFDIIADEVPLYGLFHRKLTTGWKPDHITGFRPISVSGLDFTGSSAVPPE